MRRLCPFCEKSTCAHVETALRGESLRFFAFLREETCGRHGICLTFRCVIWFTAETEAAKSGWPIVGMNKAGNLAKLWHRDYLDVLGLDLGGSGIKAVRMKMIKRQVFVTAVEVLPGVKMPPEEGAVLAPLAIPRSLKARHVALASSGGGTQVKLLSFPAHSEKTVDAHILELMGLGDHSQYRIAYEPLVESRVEVRVLAVAFPDTIGRSLCRLFPLGTPAPCSIEASGLASMTAFSKGPGTKLAEGCVAAIDFGMNTTLVAFYNKGIMVLVRKFDFGAANVLRKLQENLGVDQEVAMGILSDGSFDVSRVVHAAMEPFLQQLVISWDFVERRENVHIKDLYACGGGVGVGLWGQEIEAATGQRPVVWNPFEGVTVQPGAYSDSLKGQESRFAGAIGAAWSMLGTR